MYVAYGRVLLQIGMESKDTLLNAGAMPEEVVEGLAASTMGGGEKRRKVVDLDRVTFEGDEAEEAEQEEGAEQEGEDQEAESEEEGDSPNEDEALAAGDELELAWEVLDLARLIYADSASTDGQAKVSLSDVYCDLGDVSMETESFEQAADDFAKAIEIKKELGDDHERALASAYFKHAMALEYAGRMAEAAGSLAKARTVLKARLDRLVEASDDKGKEKACANAVGGNEIDELQQLLPEVDAKLEDVNSQPEGGKTNPMDPSQLKASMKAAAMGAVQDLSGLVRKRKVEE